MPEPEILFSPLPKPEPDHLRDARSAESVLFKLDQSLAAPEAESAHSANDPPPGKLSGTGPRPGSGLVDIGALLELRAAQQAAEAPALASQSLSPAPAPQTEGATRARPRIPTPLLLTAVLALLAAFALLAWKVQALL